MGRIVAEWEAFASTLLPAARSLDAFALRDHAVPILQAVIKDLSTPQTKAEQHDKSIGHARKPFGASRTAAQTHALLRARGGFSISQLNAEYRALRASVLRLWIDECGPTAPHMDDMIRFNEAIDQAVAESVDFFDKQEEQARNLLLGMLGHDMRSPLHTIQVTAAYLETLDAGEEVSDSAARLIRTCGRLNSLLDDLGDFNRTKLGLGIKIAPSPVDLSRVFGDEIDQLRAAYPDRQIDLEVTGDVQGVWDGRRLQQLLANLVLNAIKYGDPGTAIRIALSGQNGEVRFHVTNSGPAIKGAALDRIFDPLVHASNSKNRDGASMGLGLFIAREIAKAHSGTIDARSDAAHTTLAVRLPRRG